MNLKYMALPCIFYVRKKLFLVFPGALGAAIFFNIQEDAAATVNGKMQQGGALGHADQKKSLLNCFLN
ncbi:hypothetical protein [Bacillus sp. J33]|uniref:hypothetical protein n=1 Tax=Bacillus sp. J33 TaxID=935836 RepID=UPI00047D79B7|nr:hypothetical protein [Bacillus sp. J33]